MSIIDRFMKKPVPVQNVQNVPVVQKTEQISFNPPSPATPEKRILSQHELADEIGIDARSVHGAVFGKKPGSASQKILKYIEKNNIEVERRESKAIKFGGFTLAEIAEAAGCSKGTVRAVLIQGKDSPGYREKIENFVREGKVVEEQEGKKKEKARSEIPFEKRMDYAKALWMKGYSHEEICRKAGVSYSALLNHIGPQDPELTALHMKLGGQYRQMVNAARKEYSEKLKERISLREKIESFNKENQEYENQVLEMKRKILEMEQKMVSNSAVKEKMENELKNFSSAN